MSIHSIRNFFLVRILNYSYLKIIFRVLYYFHLILSDYQLVISLASFGAYVFVHFYHFSAQAPVEWYFLPVSLWM